MEYKIDGWNNFCRVFVLPTEYPNEYCFAGPPPVTMGMVDWFHPLSLGIPAISKEEWIARGFPLETEIMSYQELYDHIVPFVRQKNYILPELQYLVLCEFGAALTFKGVEHGKL